MRRHGCANRPTAAAPDAALPTAARGGQSAGGARRAGATVTSHWRRRGAGRKPDQSQGAPKEARSYPPRGLGSVSPSWPLPPEPPLFRLISAVSEPSASRLTSLRKGGTQPDTSRSVKTPLCYKVRIRNRHPLLARILACLGCRVSAASGHSCAGGLFPWPVTWEPSGARS